jgi:sll1239 protein
MAIENEDCFSNFEDIPLSKKDKSVQVLYDYEKHYMDLVRKYSSEIEFVSKQLMEFRKEQKEFYDIVLPKIIDKLNGEKAIDDDTRKVWMKRFVDNMDKSFSLSETLINDYVVKTIDEFKNEVKEKLDKS